MLGALFLYPSGLKRCSLPITFADAHRTLAFLDSKAPMEPFMENIEIHSPSAIWMCRIRTYENKSPDGSKTLHTRRPRSGASQNKRAAERPNAAPNEEDSYEVEITGSDAFLVGQRQSCFR
jgi:hypothetical protein